MRAKFKIAMTVLIVLSVICIFSLCASAEVSGECGTKATWVLDDSGVLTISGSGMMRDYSFSGSALAPWNAERANIKKVVIADGITRIGGYAFYKCNQITEVSVADTVTEIGAYAFSSCTALADINFPSSLTLVDGSAFYMCKGLTTATIKAGVTYKSSVFEKCTSITSAVIEDGVTELPSRTFYGCTSLADVQLPDSVVSIKGGVFYSSALTSFTLKSTVTYSTYIFEECTALSDVTVEEGVTKIPYGTFSGCSALKEIELPDTIETIEGSAFSETGLTSFTIPEKVEKIASLTFSGCKSLASIVIPKTVTEIADGAFYSKTVLKGYQGSAAESYAVLKGYTFEYLDGEPEEEVKVTIAEGICGDNATWKLDHEYTLTISGTGAMGTWNSYTSVPWKKYTADIKEVIIEDGITEIEDYSFYKCSALEKVTLPDTLEKVGRNAFYICTALKEVEIPSHVTVIDDYAFYNCTALSDVTLSSGLETIGMSAFKYCSKIKELTIPFSVTTIDFWAFDDITDLTLKVYQNSYAEDYAIDEGIKHVNLGKITNAVTVAEGTFGADNSLKWVVDSGRELHITGEGAIPDYSSTSAPWAGNTIREVNIGEGVTRITKCGITGARHVTIAGSVGYIASDAINENATVYGYKYSIAEYYCNTNDITFVNLGTLEDKIVVRGTLGDFTYTITSRGVLTMSGQGAITEKLTGYNGYIKKVVLADGITAINCAFVEDFANLTEMTISYTVISGTYYFYTTIPNENLTIRGYTNSYFENIAKNRNYKFISIGTMPDVTLASGTVDSIDWSVTSYGVLTVTGEGAIPYGFGDKLGLYESYTKEIIISEGITDIERYAMAWFDNAVKMTTPSTLRTVGSNALPGDETVVYCYKYSGVHDYAEEFGFEYHIIGESPLWTVAEGTYGDNITWRYENHRNLFIEGSGLIKDGTPPWKGYLDTLLTVTIGKDITLFGDGSFEKQLTVGNDGSYYGSLGELTTVYGYTNSMGELVARNLGAEFVSLGVLEDDYVILSGNLTDTITYEVDCLGNLAITGTGAMPDYASAYKTPWGVYDYSPVRRVVVSDGITRIGDYALTGTGNAVSITLGSDIESVGNGAFYGAGASEIILPENVSSIGEAAFGYCMSLKKLTIPEGVNYIEKSTFYRCIRLEEIHIPASVLIIKANAFQYCNEFTIYGYDSSAADRYAREAGLDFVSVGEVEEVSFTGATYSNGISWKIDNFGNLTFYGEGAMPDLSGGSYMPWYNEYKSNVVNVIFEDGITHLGKNAVSHTKVKSIKLPDSVTSISPWAIYMNNELETLWLSKGMSEIPQNAFVSNGLKRIYIPSSIKTIGEGSFDDTWISDVYYGGQAAYWLTSVEGKEYLYNAQVHYTSTMNAVLSAVQSTEGISVEISENLTGNKKVYIAGYKDGALVALYPAEESDTYLIEEDVDMIKVFFWNFKDGYEPVADVYENEF